MKTQIRSLVSDEERSLYHLTDAEVIGCRFTGPADGESALKETRNIAVSDCTFDLRYPMWHCEGFTLTGSRLTETCRAPLWYASDGVISDTKIDGVKALRECDRISVKNCEAVSAEFGWKCRGIDITDSSLTSEYVFLGTKDLTAERLTQSGKYSFQYTENVAIRSSLLNTKDAFWHAKNVRVTDTEIRGEYLGWYSDGLTLERCKIIGTQPFCYCKNLTLIDCEMIDCDLAFEYSDVHADVRGSILSVKNPRSGLIAADEIGEIIREDAVYPCGCRVEIRKK